MSIKLDKLCTLNDFQKLLGNINWIRPYLKITTGELSPLFQILHGDSDPRSPRNMTPEALLALSKVEAQLNQAKVKQLSYTDPWDLVIFKTPYTPTGCLWQSGILEWIHLSHVQSKMLASYPYMCSLIITKGRQRSKKLFGKEMHNIIIPYNKKQFEILLTESEDWGIALQGFTGQIQYHYPKHPLIEFYKETEIIFPSRYLQQRLEAALCIFTDGSSNGKFAVYVQDHEPLVRQEKKNISAQQAEIKAVILAFQTYAEKFNLFTDSKFVVSLFPAIETALLSGNSRILPHLQILQKLIRERAEKFYIGHICGHSNLPGPLSKGNEMADALTRNLVMNVTEAQKSHNLHHQNALALKRMFKLTREQARQIIKNCGTCPPVYHPPKMGVNPRGLKALVLWQMDVTHIPESGKLAFVHVTVDTYSHMVLCVC